MLSHPRHIILYVNICLVIILGGAALMAYWAFFDGTVVNPVIHFEQTMNLPTDKTTYKQGEKVYARMSFCKYRAITPTAQWALVDTYLRFYEPSARTIGELGCKKDILVQVEKIPEDTYKGTYHYSGQLFYQVNPFRTIEIHLQTQDFNVECTPTVC